MRNTYLDALYNLAQKDEEVVSLVADNGLIVYDDFRRDFPDRYFNFGISEGHMIAAAAGMASCGKIPFVYTISAFLAYRGYEFLRDDVCFQDQNVKIVGIGSGLTYSTLGPSHHTTEDIGLLRSIPNLTVFSPSTRAEVKWIMEESYKNKGPVYIRLSNNSKEYYEEGATFEIGVPSVIKSGENLTLIITGSIINEAMKVSEMLEADGINTEVVSIHTLKPMRSEAIASLVSKTGRVVVLEEHNVIGGLYSAISEAMIEERVCVPCMKIGLHDIFAEGYGNIDDVRAANGLDSNSVYNQIKKFMNE
ncbi:MAG: transketolase [Lachnospiraceae bacterium]|nr:transketolase [Lachnospiraceae bacterium]